MVVIAEWPDGGNCGDSSMVDRWALNRDKLDSFKLWLWVQKQEKVLSNPKPHLYRSSVSCWSTGTCTTTKWCLEVSQCYVHICCKVEYWFSSKLGANACVCRVFHVGGGNLTDICVFATSIHCVAAERRRQRQRAATLSKIQMRDAVCDGKLHSRHKHWVFQLNGEVNTVISGA